LNLRKKKYVATTWTRKAIRKHGLAFDMSEFIKDIVLKHGGIALTNVIATYIDFGMTKVLTIEKRCSDFYRNIDEFKK
jgi:hypothetical protein